MAEESEDRNEACRAKLNLIMNVEGSFGAAAISALIKETQREVASLADAHLASRLHLARARAEAKRGLFEAADQHHEKVDTLLSREANKWLEGILRLDESAVAYVRGDFGPASERATHALRLSKISGHARTEYAALSNLATVRLAEGRSRDASVFFSAARGMSCVDSEVRMALLESDAQAKLESGDLGSCESALDEIDRDAAASGRDRPSWYQPLFRLTRARLLLRRGQPEEAVAVLDDAIRLGARHSDSVRLRLLKADALIGLGRLDESEGVMDEIMPLSGSCSPAVAAEIERVKGELLAKLGRPTEGRRHLERATRVLSAIGSASARDQAEHALAWVRSASEATPGQSRPPDVVDAAAVLGLSQNPELLGREALAMLSNLGCTRGVALVVTRNGLPLEVLAHDGWSAGEAREVARATAPEARLALGEVRGRQFYLTVEPKPEMAARDRVAGVRRLVETAVELEGHRRDERQRSSLMPFEPAGEPDGVFLSDEMLKVVAIARRIATSELPVLITGETGTGKEVLARLIHAASGRSAQTFVAFNCTGLPRDTAESQLFGHRRGSFTDAREDSPGVIRGAAGGTLMLDEIGELDPSIQPKLLRFLDSGEIQPVGEPTPMSADVRVIAATNVAIDTLVREGRFREDLFYRLNVIRLRVPPLRERREEIPPLVQHFLRRYGREMKRSGLSLSQDALTYLLLYDWPGNVRQLANEIRRIVAMAEPDDTIRPYHLSPEVRAAREGTVEHRSTGPAGSDPAELSVRIDQTLSSAVEQVERAMLARALRESGGRVNAAAELLGLSRKGLFLKRRRLGIETESVAEQATERSRATRDFGLAPRVSDLGS
jgi:DNA-binding NtrC family response regulator/tetratricopeptide (TPR) repeat protein